MAPARSGFPLRLRSTDPAAGGEGTRRSGDRRPQPAGRRRLQNQAHPHRTVRSVRRKHAFGLAGFELEQFEFPFQVVYPKTLDAGDLEKKFDVLIFTDGAFRGAGAGGRGGGGGRGGAANNRTIPEECEARQGRISAEKTIPQIKKFVEAGGSIITVGSSTSMAQLLGVPVTNYLIEMTPKAENVPLPREKFYIPGSLMRVTIDNTNPLAYGMP